MKRRVRRTVWGVLGAVACAAVASEVPAEDPRSVELLVYGCASDLGSEQVALFANGTVRLRRISEGSDERQLDEMQLIELSPDELQAYLRRLRLEDLSESESSRYGPVGEWVEQCSLQLELPEEQPRRYRFGRYDSLDLVLSRVVRIAHDLIAEVEQRDSRQQLPADYLPRPGDLLERVDGARFEIVGYTWDGAGLELRGVDQPILLYLPAGELGKEFVAVLERGRE